MPAYEYLCPDCGPFVAIRPMAEFQAPYPCEGCGAEAPRAMLTAPSLSAMDGGRRHAQATNERSANAPTKSTRHPSSCGCCTGAGRATLATGGRAKLTADAVPAAKSFPAQRPWMIGH